MCSSDLQASGAKTTLVYAGTMDKQAYDVTVDQKSGAKGQPGYAAIRMRVINWDHHRTRPTKDHFIPKSKKQLLMGSKPIFFICCQPCNSRKSDNVFSSIEEVREFITSRKRKLKVNIDGH